MNTLLELVRGTGIFTSEDHFLKTQKWRLEGQGEGEGSCEGDDGDPNEILDLEWLVDNHQVVTEVVRKCY